MKPIVIDFETEAIEPRPKYPPKPVGVAIMAPGKKPQYLAWGHPTENNCDQGKAREILKDIWRGDRPLLFHNAKFDLDVAEAHLGLKLPAWDRVHDTLYTLFLHDPHAESLSLKPASERLLGMKPEEQDAVRDWLVEHGVIAKNQNHGAFIAKAPGGVVGKYAIGDVARTLKLHELLYPKLDKRMREACDRERRLMPILLANERQGMRFDVERASKDIATYQAAIVKVEEWLRKRLKAKDLNFDADTDVGDALDRAKVVMDWVWTKGGKGRAPQRSVAKKNLTVERFEDKEVFYGLGYRNRLQTVLSLNLVPWLEMAEANGGMIFTEWNQVRQSHGRDNMKGARTGRISCSRFQNISKDFYDKGDGYKHPKMIKLPELPLVRQYLLPDKGQMFGHVDYSQQEFRITAHYEDGDLAETYRKNPRIDYHTMMQERIVETIGTRYERRFVKITNFAIEYGVGVALLAQMLGTDMETAGKLRSAVKLAAPGIVALDAELKRRGKSGEPIRTWGGRLYYCEPPAYSKKFGREMTFEYKLLNYLIQGSAADCTKEAIIRYHDVKRESRMLATVHDEINISCPKRGAKQEIRKLQDAMESIEFDVPMLTDAALGPSWGELEDIK